VHCAARSRLWEEKLFGTSPTWAVRAEENHASQSTRHDSCRDRRTFWRQSLGTWRSQADKACWAEHETVSASHGPGKPIWTYQGPPRNLVETLNSLINHLCVLEIWTNLHGISKLAESTVGQTQTLSPQDQELIQLQLNIWASSFNGRLSIWHAGQILRHSLDTNEFATTISDGRTLEPVAKQAYYPASLVL
jgi:hypothetical protein